MPKITRATVITPGQLRHLLRVTEATSRHPERDAAILLLGLCCGMRCTETAQVTVADILFPSGKLRTEVSLRAVITKGCKQRCVYISSPKLKAALERYLEHRWTNCIGTFPPMADAVYRGLRHNLPLFITRKGGKFELNIKRRILETGEYKEYWAADSLQSYITRLYAKAGIKGGSIPHRAKDLRNPSLCQDAQYGCCSAASWPRNVDCTMRYIDVDKRILRQAFIDVI